MNGIHRTFLCIFILKFLKKTVGKNFFKFLDQFRLQKLRPRGFINENYQIMFNFFIMIPAETILGLCIKMALTLLLWLIWLPNIQIFDKWIWYSADLKYADGTSFIHSLYYSNII
jgi:hypothetical protein